MNHITRRDYLKATAALGGSLMIQSFAIGKPGGSVNGKLNVALIGLGGIANTAFGDCRRENVVAVAEVDDVRGAPGLEAFPNAKRYKDFRKMLDAHEKELDLVIVSTPDHTHFAATFDAMQRGIAVHVQKPLTHNIWQARTLQAAARKFDVQTVMGNQGHNFEGMRLIKDWYDAGLAGTVREVHAWTNRTTTNNANGKRTYQGQPIPTTLDWDLWQGPNTPGEYNKTFCPAGWRWHWDYGMGGLGDIGCHTLDIPIFCMGLG
jgi:predicted dehydrogenase